MKYNPTYGSFTFLAHKNEKKLIGPKNFLVAQNYICRPNMTQIGEKFQLRVALAGA